MRPAILKLQAVEVKLSHRSCVKAEQILRRPALPDDEHTALAGYTGHMLAVHLAGDGGDAADRLVVVCYIALQRLASIACIVAAGRQRESSLSRHEAHAPRLVPPHACRHVYRQHCADLDGLHAVLRPGSCVPRCRNGAAVNNSTKTAHIITSVIGSRLSALIFALFIGSP